MVLRPTRSVPALLLLPLLMAVGCGDSTRLVTLPGPDQATVPQGAIDAIARLWSGAEPGLPPGGSGCGEGATSPTALTADLNGDGAADAVLWATVDAQPRLAVVFTRTNAEYLAVPVGDRDVQPTGVIEIARRGAPHQRASLTVDSYYGLDTIVVRACDGARTAWFWTGSRFEPQRLAD